MESNRIAALDGLRCFAVFGVLLIHADVLYGGFYGVDVFFTLSGFLITRLLLAEREATGTLDFKAFFVRRALRLIPAAAVAVAAAVAASWIHTGTLDNSTSSGVLSVATGWSNWQILHYGGVGLLNSFWSLSIEDQFYATWPPILFCLMRSGQRHALLAVLSMAIAVDIAHIAWLSSHNASGARLFYGTDVRMISLLVGCWLAVALSMITVSPMLTRAAQVWPFAACGLILSVALAGRTSSSGIAVSLIAVGIATAMLIVSAVYSPGAATIRLLAWAPVAYGGQISYGIYLWNPIVLSFIHVSSGAFRLLLLSAVTVAVAAASHRWIEQPCLRRAKRDHRPAIPTTNLSVSES